jgi:hypothetical protein
MVDTCNYHDLVWPKKTHRQLQIWHQNIEKWTLDVNKKEPAVFRVDLN